MTSYGRLLLISAISTAACSSNTVTTDGAVPDSSPDTSTADAVVDAPLTDATNPNAPLTYTPAGCGYTVTTAAGTRQNQLSADTTFGADPTPLDVHVTWPSDPTTTAAVLWATSDGTLASVVQFGTSAGALSATAHGHVSTAGSGANAVHMHEVHLCGLIAGTTYYYQAGGDGHYSPVQSFRTAPVSAADNDVNFAVAGDSRDSASIWQMTQSQILSLSGAQQPDFEVFTGDAVLLGTVQPYWNAWFDAASATQSVMPFVFVHGNHETTAVNYFAQIAQPQFGNVEQDELYFSLNYGPIHIVVLNDTPIGVDFNGVVGGTERTWLDTDLRAVNRSQTPWIVVAHHRGAFSSSTHSTDPETIEVRSAWPPIYAQYGVDLVLNGHDHDFEITQPLLGDGTLAPAGQRGTVYVTAAGSGATLYPNAMSSFTRYSESTYNFLLVHATSSTLEVNPYRLDGSPITDGHLALTR